MKLLSYVNSNGFGIESLNNSLTIVSFISDYSIIFFVISGFIVIWWNSQDSLSSSID